MAKAIQVDYKKRTELCKALKESGEALTGTEKPNVEKGSLSLDGVEKLEDVQKQLRTLVINFGKVVEKDAKNLQNIAEAFRKTDNSAAP